MSSGIFQYDLFGGSPGLGTVPKHARPLRGPLRRPMNGLSGPSVVSTDPITGNVTVADGYGNTVVNDPSGQTISYSLSLGQSVAWLQAPVYIAVGAGLGLGFLVMKLLGRK